MNTKTLRTLVITLVLCMALACGVALAAGPSVCPNCGSPVVVTEPTCGDDGSWSCTNSECGASGVIPATGNHTWITREPTCGDDGQRLCSVCGLHEVLPATGNHTWITREPTCGDDGQRLCSVCGLHEVLPATGNHTWITREPTCGKDGQRLCSVCGLHEVLPATGNHTFTTYVSDNNATCGADGTETATCDVCGIGTDTRTVPGTATGNHTFTTYTYNNDATCGKDGTKTATCDVCKTATDTIQAEGTATGEHTWDDGVVTLQPTYDEEGEMTYTCTVCGATMTEPIDKLTPTNKPTAKPTKKPSSSNSKPSSGSSSSSNAAPAATEAPALPYGSIVSDVERAEEPYVSETVADETGANTILVITVDPDEDGSYTLRNLHLTDALLSQLKSEGILTVRFVVGDATVEFPVASYTGDAATTIRGDLEADVTAFLVTIDPNATTADGTAGVSVGSSVTTSDGGEYDITPLIPDITLSIGGTAAQPVTTASVYTADASAATPVEEPAPVEEAPVEPAIEEAPAEPALEDSAAA